MVRVTVLCKVTLQDTRDCWAIERQSPMIWLVIGGALLAYGVMIKEQGAKTSESMPWFAIVVFGLLCIFAGCSEIRS
jgi:hypothetical protein